MCISSYAAMLRSETQVVVGRTSYFFLFRTFLNLLFIVQNHFVICLLYLFIYLVFNLGPIKKKEMEVPVPRTLHI